MNKQLSGHAAVQSVLSVLNADSFPVCVQRVTRLISGKRPFNGHNVLWARKSEALGDSSNEEGRGCAPGSRESRGEKHHLQLASMALCRRFD